jgi:hypothetical protein
MILEQEFSILIIDKWSYFTISGIIPVQIDQYMGG